MQSFFTLRRALRHPFSAQSLLLNDGHFHFASRFFASSGGGEFAKSLSRNCGQLGMNATQMLGFRSSIHSVARKEFERMGGNSGHMDFSANRRGSEEGRSSQADGSYAGQDGFQRGGNSGHMDFSANRRGSDEGRNSQADDSYAGQDGFQRGGNSGPIDFSAYGRNFEERRNLQHGGFSAGRDRFQMGGNYSPINFSASQRGFGEGRYSLPRDFVAGRNGFQRGSNTNPMGFSPDPRDFEAGRATRPMEFVRGIVEQDDMRFQRREVFNDADFVVIKLLRNNTFVSVTDSKGNTKAKTYMSAGKLQAAQGGGKLSQYSAEATAEHVGRVARELGLKSFVVKVNGFTYFKKKRQAIMSFKEGFTQSQRGENPIVYIEDTTRKAHNGCRLPRKRRI